MTLFFDAIGAKKSFKRNAKNEGSAPRPRHLLKKVDENFPMGEYKL